MRQFIYTMFISNNRASFFLWWKENLVKHQKVSKYYENDHSYKAKVINTCGMWVFWKCKRPNSIFSTLLPAYKKNYSSQNVLISVTKKLRKNLDDTFLVRVDRLIHIRLLTVYHQNYQLIILVVRFCLICLFAWLIPSSASI